MLVSRAKLDEMKEYQSFQRMIRNRADNTIERYARDMFQIRRKLSMTPDEIVEFAKSHSELDVGDLKAKLVEGLTPAMAYIYNNDFRRLLGSNGYRDLPEERMHYIPEQDHEAYSKDNIRGMLEWINFPRGKLLVTIPAESGLRIHTVLSLKYHHIKDDFEKGQVPIFIKFSRKEREKAKGTGYPFLGEGSNRLLKECIEKHVIKKEPEAYIFAGSNKARNPENLGGPLTYASVHDILELAREKTKVNKSIQPNHGLRKYFEHALIKAEIPEPIIKRFMGHSLGSGDAYVTKDVDQLREYYRKAWPQINFESQLSEVAELADLEKRVRQLEDERLAWTDQFIKLLTEWGSGKKANKSNVREFARFILEHGSVKERSSVKA